MAKRHRAILTLIWTPSTLKYHSVRFANDVAYRIHPILLCRELDSFHAGSRVLALLRPPHGARVRSRHAQRTLSEERSD
eukprot:3010194-Rhodomonas_salina.2